MNPRICELALQAGFIDKGNNITAYKNFDHEKFAELIARECIEIIKNNTPHFQENEWECGARYGFEESVIVIQEEFGIKE